MTATPTDMRQQLQQIIAITPFARSMGARVREFAKGERLWARGKVLKAGGRLLVVQADVFAVDQGREKHVAVALATIAKAGAA